MTRDEAVRMACTAANVVGDDDEIDWDTAAFHRALREHGYKVVPVEPTKEMVVAGAKTKGGMELLQAASFAELSGYPIDVEPDDPAFQQIYRAMLEAVR